MIYLTYYVEICNIATNLSHKTLITSLLIISKLAKIIEIVKLF